MSGIDSVIIAAVISLAGTLIGFLVNRRAIESAAKKDEGGAAQSLADAASDLIVPYREENETLRKRIDTLEARVAKLEAEVEAEHAEKVKLIAEKAQIACERDEALKEVERLKAEVALLKTKIATKPLST